jgi:GNAT superfamily N-acetyltransferase
MRHLHTVLKTPSPLAPYQAERARRAVEGDVVLLEVGPVEARHHHVIVLGPVAPAEVYARARAFYGSDRADSFELAAEYAPQMEEDLRRRGWKMTEEEPALVLERTPALLPPPPAELAIRRVRDEAGLEDFFSISRTGRRHVPSVEAVRASNVGVLVGYVDGQAVATSRLSGHGAVWASRTAGERSRRGCDAHRPEVADIMGVVTRPEHRRRGYGTAMTWAAVGLARDMGCRAFVLTATDLGYPVYVKMGFVPVCTMRTYEAREEPAAG